MSEDEQYPERGYNTEDVEALRTAEPRPRGFARRHWGKLVLAGIVLVPTAIVAAWVAIALSFSYSAGEHTGYVQRFARKGWICKTWEGQIAMVNVPGQLANTFEFTVRDDSIAGLINQYQEKLLALSYKEHRGLPSRCFGETDYFVHGVRVVGQ